MSTTSGPGVRREDHRFLTGAGRYVADLSLPDQLHAVLVRSPHAHATLEHLDASQALEIPGVVAVHTQRDLLDDGLGPLPCIAELADGSAIHTPPRHALAGPRAMHVGDPVALVLAESLEAARDGAEAVAVDYAPLPAITDPLTALGPDAPALWPDAAPGNLAFCFRAGDLEATEAALAGAAHVVEIELHNQRVSALPLEPRAGLARFDPDSQRFELVATAQGLHALRRQLADHVFHLPRDRFHLHAPDVGGGFGLKNFLYPEWVLLPWAARRHARPVKWVAERDEELSAACHGRDIHLSARLGLDAQGHFLALSTRLVANMGAYLSGSGPGVSTKALPTALGGVYDVPHMHLESRGAFTSTAPVDAYRGAGKPEANYLMERLIDVAARRCGFDPLGLRRRNILRAFPHTTALGQCIDGGAFARGLERAATLADRDGLAGRRRAAAADGWLLGQGIACFLETARGVPSEQAALRFPGDGQVEVVVGTESHGQGHESTFTRLAASRLGLPLDRLRFVQADTDRIGSGHGHGGARSMHMGGTALVRAIEATLARGAGVAAALLQADPDGVRFRDGRFRVEGDGRSIGLLEVAAAAREQAPGGEGLDTVAAVHDAPFTFPNGTHVAEVAIRRETGELRLTRYLCVDDYGEVLDPVLTRGQVHGGVAQGLGQALVEAVVYEPDGGQLLSGSLMDYALPRASLLPPLEVHLEGVPTGANPLGVKGSGQAGSIAAPQCVVNAIADALAPMQVDEVPMPATAERLWRLMRDATP